MRFFYKMTIMAYICISFSFQQQSVGASSEKMGSDSMSQGTYVKGTVADRSVSLNKDLKTSIDFLSYQVSLGYFFSLAKNHTLMSEVTYYRTGEVEESLGSVSVKDKDLFKRRETTISFQYKGTYEIADELEVLFGAHLSTWKFKGNKDDKNVVLYGSILNPTYEQASPVQLSPYLGVTLRPWSSGKVIMKVGWNHHLFQSESIKTEIGETGVESDKQQSVTIRGGHSGVVKIKYKQDFGFLKAAVLARYNHVMVSRSARYEALSSASFQESSIEDIDWSNLTFAGKVSYSITQDMSVKVWGAYDFGDLEYATKGEYKTRSEAEAAKGVKLKGDHQSLSGGIGLVYNF